MMGVCSPPASYYRLRLCTREHVQLLSTGIQYTDAISLTSVGVLGRTPSSCASADDTFESV